MEYLFVHTSRIISNPHVFWTCTNLYCRDVYTKRFPELESLVVQPLEYLMTARELKNDLENVKNNDTLLQYLSQVGTVLLLQYFHR